MNKTIDSGSDSLAVSKQNEAKSSAFSNNDMAARFVAAEVQMIREMINGPRMSDEATTLYLARVAEVAMTIGPKKFHEIVVHIIDNFSHRPTVANFRQLAGLNKRLSPEQDAVASAWETVTLIIRKHMGRDGEGRAILASHVARQPDNTFKEEKPPEIPTGVKNAVIAMGGWGALADAYPQYWGQRWNQFLQLYRGEPVTALVVK